MFDALHTLFLKPYGQYVLTFNMETLAEPGPARDTALAVVRKWLSAIAVHTGAQKSAPIVFAGTHKDKVEDPSVHGQISVRLYQKIIPDTLHHDTLFEAGSPAREPLSPTFMPPPPPPLLPPPLPQPRH